MKRLLIVLAYVCGSLLLSLQVFGQMSDRGMVTGLVSDPSGAVVPGATVTVTNESTGVATVAVTTSSGNYSTPPVILGTYTVKVEKTGFKTYLRTGILLRSGATYRQDAVLEVGAVTQTIEVTAAATLMNVQNAEVSHTINPLGFADLPVTGGGDWRLPETLAYIMPGFVPQENNAREVKQGRINGGGAISIQSWVDGAPFSWQALDNHTSETSVPFEAVREMKVLAGTMSAQYGRMSGGVFQYTTKSGTSKLHGSLYEFHSNQHLNGVGEVIQAKPPVFIFNEFGFNIGGPAYIPKVYDGRKKTFFFVNMTQMHMRVGQLPSYSLTVPTNLARTGDFSRSLNTAVQRGTDVLGRPIYQGEIFNPATTRLVGAIPVRDGYGFDPVTGLPIPGQANIIPAGDPLRSAVAAKLVPWWDKPQRDTVINNEQAFAATTVSGASPKIDTNQWLVRVDHAQSDSLRFATTVMYTMRDQIYCSGVGGCDPSKFDGNTNHYVGSAGHNTLNSRVAHLQIDWMIKSNLFNHTTIGYDRWSIPTLPVNPGATTVSELGLKGVGAYEGGLPSLGFSGGPTPYSGVGRSSSGVYIRPSDDWGLFNDTTWVKGSHTVKWGMEWRHVIDKESYIGAPTTSYRFNFAETAGYNAAGNQLSTTGDSFASMMLGQVDGTTTSKAAPYFIWYDYISLWAQDDFKLSPKLTLGIGLRWETQTPEIDKWNRYSSFDPTVTNPGAGNILGAMAFAGVGGHKRTFQDQHYDNWGPRLSLTYQLRDKTVLRGGYGIYYGQVGMDEYAGHPTQGFGVNAVLPNLTNGLYPVMYWDDTLPYAIPPMTNINPSVANLSNAFWDNADSIVMPRMQSWTFSIQHEIAGNVMLDVAYVGNRGTRLPSAGSMRGLENNMNNPSVLSLGEAVLNSNINSAAAQAVPAIQAMPIDPGTGNHSPFPGFKANVAQALRPWPQYLNFVHKNTPLGRSYYNSLQVTLDKRWSNGLQGRVAFVWSKLITDTESGVSGFNTGVQNPLDKNAEMSLSKDDIPKTLIVHYIYQLPFGPGKKFVNKGGAAGKILGGWRVAATHRYDQGRPLGVYMDNNIGNLLFTSFQGLRMTGGKRPNKVGGGEGTMNIGDFNPNNQTGASGRYVTYAGWSNPGATGFGNASRMDPTLRGFHFFNENLNLIKDTAISESMNVRFEALISNALNRHTWCAPNLNWSSTAFGTSTGQCNDPRRISLGLKFEF
jgi:hypothetical protein